MEVEEAEKIELDLNQNYFNTLRLFLLECHDILALKSFYEHDFGAFLKLINTSHTDLINIFIIHELNRLKGWSTEKLREIFPVLHGLDSIVLDLSDFHDVVLSPKQLEEFHISFLNTSINICDKELEFSSGKSHSKYNGSFYTGSAIVEKMCDEALTFADSASDPDQFKALDFASGTGNFYFYLLQKTAQHLNRDPLQCAKENVFAFDKDEAALSILRYRAAIDLDISDWVDFDEVNCNIKSMDFIDHAISKFGIANLPLFESESTKSIDFPHKFNIIVSNPPYLNLKYNKPSKSNLPDSAHAYYRSSTKSLVEKIRTSGAFSLTSGGMLNLYRLSTDLMLRQLKPRGSLSIICPSSIFADKTATQLRTELLNKYDIKSITYFREDANLFEGVIQSTVIFSATNSTSSSEIEISTGEHSFKLAKSVIKKAYPTLNEIPLIGDTGWTIIQKLTRFPKLSSNKSIRNKRGELDLTLHREYIVNTPGPHILIRGNRLKKEGIDRNHTEFVDFESFKLRKSSEYLEMDYGRSRLICNQISNVDSSTRLRFLMCEGNDIIGNSCNYISFVGEDIPHDFYINQLNSPLLNWYFKTSSSNNHINNYELDNLPLLDHKSLNKEQIQRIAEGDISFLYGMFGLTEKEIAYVEDFK